MALLSSRPVFRPIIQSAVLASGFGAAIHFMAAVGVARALPSVTPFFLCYVVSSIGIRLGVGRMPDRIGHGKVSIPASLSMVFALLVLSGASDWMTLALAGLLFGASHGVTYPSLQAMVVGGIPARYRGRALGLYSGAFSAGSVVAAFAYGVVAEQLGYGMMFQVAAGIVALGTTVFLALGRPVLS